MKRRTFFQSAALGGMAAAMTPLASCSNATHTDQEAGERYKLLGELLQEPVFKKELFTAPVIIASVELLSFENSYICHVRSEDGAEGISVAHNDMRFLVPIFVHKVQAYFIGQDARELDLIVEKVFDFHFNFRYGGIPLGIPLATIEFAILDMMGKISGLPMGQLVGDLHNEKVGVYIATEFRERPLEEHFEKILETVAAYDAKAIKIKVGYLFAGSRDIHDPGLPGKSEKLVAMVREHYGSDWSLYADSNGYYDAEGAIRMGRILEENNYAYFEEPVMFDHFLEIKKVADALSLPVANGEQDHSYYNFRWLLANEGLEIVQPDNYYFGGFIRSMRVARMANALGKTCIPHMSGGALGYLYNSHFVSVLPNAGEHHEFKGYRTHVPFECPTSSLKVEEGKITVPTGPGLGIAIDPDFIEKHAPVNA